MKHVGISEMYVTAAHYEQIVVDSITSCVVLALYDPVARVGGVVHCMLPVSKISPEKASGKPCMFVDTGVVLLIESLLNLGASLSNLEATIAGASAMFDGESFFKVGERNYIVLKEILRRNHINVIAESVKGTCTRRLSLDMATGIVDIKKIGDREDEDA